MAERRRELPGRRDWDIWLGELRDDVDGLEADVGELVREKAVREDREARERDAREKALRRMIERRNRIAFWAGVCTGLGGLALTIIDQLH